MYKRAKNQKTTSNQYVKESISMPILMLLRVRKRNGKPLWKMEAPSYPTSEEYSVLMNPKVVIQGIMHATPARKTTTKMVSSARSMKCMLMCFKARTLSLAHKAIDRHDRYFVTIFIFWMNWVCAGRLLGKRKGFIVLGSTSRRKISPQSGQKHRLDTLAASR